MEWQDISTAPKSGEDVILGFANHPRPPVVAGWFGEEGWEEYDSINIVKGKPTHWMRLPSPPKPTHEDMTDEELAAIAAGKAV